MVFASNVSFQKAKQTNTVIFWRAQRAPTTLDNFQAPRGVQRHTWKKNKCQDGYGDGGGHGHGDCSFEALIPTGWKERRMILSHL